MRPAFFYLAAGLLALVLIYSGPAAFAAQSMRADLAARVLGALREAETDPDAALESLARIAAQTRTDVELAYVLSERVGLLIAEDQTATASRELRALLDDKAPDYSPPLRLLYATILLTEEDYTSALVQLEHWAAYEEAPHPQGLFLQGYSYVRLERFEDAIPPLEAAVNSPDGPRDPWLELLAYAYTRAGRSAEAVTLLQNMISDHPERTRWWKQLAAILMLQERLPEGTAGLAISENIEPLNSQDRKRLARLFAHVGMPAEGAELLTQTYAERETAPDFEELVLLGELWILARETDRAIAVLERAQAIADQGEAAMMIGQLYTQREDYERARTALNVSVAAYGESAPPYVYYLLAVVQINLGELEAAAQAVDRLAEDEDYQDRAASLSNYINQVLRQS